MRTSIRSAWLVVPAIAVAIGLAFAYRNNDWPFDGVQFCHTGSHYREARELTARGDRALSAKNYREAIKLYEASITSLGDVYVDIRANDDTGQYLVLARSLEQQGQLKDAVVAMQRVMESRFALYLFVHCGRHRSTNAIPDP